MGFSCDCNFDVAFSTKVIRRSNKSRECCECGHLILVGEEYERSSGKCEGELWSAVTCIRCADLRDSFAELGYCITYGGGLFDDYADWLGDQPAKLDKDGEPMRGDEIADAIREKHKNWGSNV